MIKTILKPVIMPHWILDLIVAIPRIAMGFMFTAFFGAPKFGMPWSPADKNLCLFEVAFWFPEDVTQFGGIFALAPAFFAWMGAFSEAVGGVFLMLGFNTRVFSFLGLCTMLVAAFCQQIGNGYWNMLPALGFGAICIFTLALGSGRFGIDYLITKNK